MYDGMRSQPSTTTQTIAAGYFVMLVVIGNYIILNLFLAILLDNFAEVGEKSEGDSGEVNAESDDDLSREVSQLLAGREPSAKMNFTKLNS